MADSKNIRIGAFWEGDTIYFAQDAEGEARKIISLELEPQQLEKAQSNILSPEGTKATSKIQETLRKNKISSSAINLSLPSRDIIFRSFIVPWMQSKEIKSVVEFEATKYIPFALKDLAYSYHAMNLTTEGGRRLRIIFVAIKKDTLERYSKLLEESALHIQVAEPAPLSIIRALVSKKKLPPDQVVAIIDKKEKFGKIIIVQENAPLFVREFQLAISSNPAVDQTVDTAELLRLTNEVRISMDYFNRQEKELKVEKIFYLGADHNDEYTKMLEEDLELPVEAVSTGEIVGDQQSSDTSFINAFGASIRGQVPLDIGFDLSKDTPQQINLSRQTFRKNLKIKEIIPTAVICLTIAFLSIGLSRYYISKQKNRIVTLEQKLGPNKESSAAKLELSYDKIMEKLNAYKNIRFESGVPFFLTSLPELLPQGTWLTKMNLAIIEGSDRKSKTDEKEQPTIVRHMELSGFAYAPFKREQFQQINNFLQRIKDSEKYREYFEDIKLEDVRSQQLGDHQVTSFNIRFQ